MNAPRHALLLGVIASLLFLLSVRHFWPTFITANESIRYFFIEAIVEDHTLTIDAAMERHHSRNVDRAERDGHAYLDKAPGASILALPAYLAWTRIAHASTEDPIDRLLFLLTLLACTLPSVVAATWLARFAEQPLLAPALLAATPLALYATQYFGHAPAAAALVLAFIAVEKRAFSLAGWLCATAVAFEYPVAPLAAMVGALGVYRGRGRALGLLALGGAPIAVALGLYHDAAFGGPFVTGYAFKASPELARSHAQGFMGLTYPHLDWLWGITFSRERGLFFLAPWLLLAAPGCVALARTDRARAVFLATCCAGSLLLIASYDYWTGGDCIGPRFLVPAVPFFALAAFHVPERWQALGAGLAVASLVQIWFAFATFTFHFEGMPDPLYTFSVPLVLGGHLAPATIPGLLYVAPWVLVAVTAWVARPKPRSVAIAAVTAVAWLVMMVATSPGSPPESMRQRAHAVGLMTGRQ